MPPQRQLQEIPKEPTQEMDLVTVTPQGLEVTPLRGSPPPAGIPVVQAAPVAQQEMDMVTVTPYGIEVTPVHAAPGAQASSPSPQQGQQWHRSPQMDHFASPYNPSAQ